MCFLFSHSTACDTGATCRRTDRWPSATLSIHESCLLLRRMWCSNACGTRTIADITRRFLDILAVQYAMKYLMHVRNKTHFYNVTPFLEALKRPEGVGLLTVCNHVTTLDSASIVPSIIPFCSLRCFRSWLAQLVKSRNCGYWNLGAEEIMFNKPVKAGISSLVKVGVRFPMDGRSCPFAAALACSKSCYPISFSEGRTETGSTCSPRAEPTRTSSSPVETQRAGGIARVVVRRLQAAISVR